MPTTISQTLSIKADGMVSASQGTWNQVHKTSTAAAADQSTGIYPIGVGAFLDGSTYRVHRFNVHLDTSDIKVKPLSGSLFIRGTHNGTGDMWLVKGDIPAGEDKNLVILKVSFKALTIGNERPPLFLALPVPPI